MNRVYQGELLEVLKTFPDHTFHAVVTDRVIRLEDEDVRDRIRDWLENKNQDGSCFSLAVWDEIMRVLKPGAHIIALTDVMSYANVATSLRLAGGEVRDQIDYYSSDKRPRPVDMYQYLVRLVMPPENGLLLDPFCGEGKVLEAAINEGHEVVGITNDDGDKVKAELRIRQALERVE